MFIHIEVALGMDGEVHHAVLAYLFQHVVEETETGRDVAFTTAIEIYLDVDIRFNYEKYFYRKGGIAKTSEKDKIVVEFMTKF